MSNRRCPVETFLYNWCLNLKNYYDITVIYGNANDKQLVRLNKIVKTVEYKSKNKFEFDIVIRNSVWGTVCDKIYSKDNRYLEMRHADYKYLLEKGRLYDQYHKWERTNEIIGCGEYVSKMSNEALNDNPKTIINILAPKKPIQKVLHLISCTRLDNEKGWNRMLKMADMMRRENIKFDWKIFTDDIKLCDYEEIKFYKSRFDIFDYIVDADYTVLLSDCEGLPYTVQESLQYKTPCIVTDVEGCTELIKDGINGYVVPLDMNFDIKKILTIPKCEEYDNKALEKWLEYLGDSEYIEKEIKIMGYKVKSIRDYTLKRFDELKDLQRVHENKQDDEEKWVRKGDIFIINEDLYKYLLDNSAIKLLEIIQEEVKVEPVKFKNLSDRKERTTKEVKTKKTSKKK